MAKRRAIERALSGLGEGIGDASSYLFKMTQQERMQDRYDKRAKDAQLAILDRQGEMAETGTLMELLKDSAKTGDVDPSVIAAVAKALGRNIDPSALEGVNPTRRRMSNSLDKSIMDATTPEGVPSDEMILGVANQRGANLPSEWSEGMLPADNDPFQNYDPSVREKSEQAGAKRRALSEVDTDLIDYEDPITGAKGKRRVPKRSPELLTGITTGPTAEQAGALKGTGKVAELEVSGDAEVAQGAKAAGANAKATFDVNNSPEAQSARIREAVNKEVATLKATMPLQLELAGKKAAAEIAQAVNKDNAQNTAAASRAAQELAPFFTKVTEITKGLNNREGIGARVKGTTKVAASYLGLAPEVNELNQLISQNLRKIAIAQGVREANVSEKETAQALEGIGLFAWTSATERRNALRNMSDLITLGPVVAARASAGATIGERMQLAQSLMQERRSVESKAIEMGADVYRDPVLGTLVPVIK